MAQAGLDLKNPGGKEAAVVGGGALLLALIYFALHKSATPAAPPTGSGTGPGGTGPGGAAGGNVPSFLLPGDTSGQASTFSGNAFTDAIATAADTGTGTSPTSGGAGLSFGPALRAPGGQGTTSETGQNALSLGASSNPFVGAGAAGVAPVGTSGNGYVTYAQIFQALRAKGLSAIAATGILGNIQAESSGNVENTSGDSGTSIGLIQWHNKDKYLVTGNVTHDFANQINNIVQWFHSAGISGSTPQAVASSFAANIENCTTCQPGQTGPGSNVERQANAAAFYQQYLKGAFNPPKPSKVAAGPTGGKPWVKGNPFYPGTKAATLAKIRSLFPKVKAALKPKPKAAAKPKSKVVARSRGVAGRL